jgi:hypothetical protein
MVPTIDASYSLMNADCVYGLTASGQERCREPGFQPEEPALPMLGLQGPQEVASGNG